MNLSDRWISKASSSSSFYAPSLLLLAVVVFLPSISFGFVYDDHIQITSNYILSSYWHIGDLLTSPTPPGDLYRPVTMFSFLVSRLLHGLSPAGFHGVNILLHAINSVLVFAVLRSLFSERLAFLSACLFAINPVHTEAVVNIVGRAELLAALFGLSAVYLTTTKDQFSYSKKVLFALLLLLSTLSKESGILYGPLAFTVLWFVPRYQREEGSRMKWVLFSSFVCAALFVLLRYMAVGEVFPSRVVDFIDNPLVHFDLSHRLLAAVSLLSDYFVLTFIPFPLSADYSFATLAPEHFAFSTETFLKVIFAGLLVLCLVFARKRSPEYAFATLWFFVAFLLTSNLFFPLGTVFAERLVYTPSVGVSLFLGALIDRFPKLPRRATFSCFCFVYLVIGLQDQYRWKDDRALVERQMEIAPQSVRTRINYAVLLRDYGKLGEATEVIDGALRILFDHPDVLYVKATILAAQGKLEEAEIMLRTSLSYSAQHVPSLNALGRLLMAKGDITVAEALFQEAHDKAPDSIDTLVSLYLLAAKQNDSRRFAELGKLLQERAPNNRDFLKLQRELYRGAKFESAAERVGGEKEEH